MKKSIITAVFSLFIIFSSNQASAWGSKGHAYVAEIAFHYLDSQTRRNVMSYLNGMTIEEAANWMDAIKSDPANNYMKPYHYLDIEKGSKEMPTGDNIVSVLLKTLKELDNKSSMSNAEIKTHLLFVFHLIGDLHQPLHLGYPGDKGGNTIKLNFLGNNSNLHAVWDSGIIEHTNMRVEDIIKGNHYTPEQQAAIQKINVIAWATQTRKYLKSVYAINDTEISEFYVDKNAEIIKTQLLDAGLRLASVLKHYFHDSGATNATTSDSTPAVTVNQTPVSVDINTIGNHIGETVTVCSKVYSTNYLESSKSKPTFLNVGADYPNDLLTVFIKESDRNNFDGKPEELYKDKNVCITGKVILYKGKSEIEVDKSSEIVVQ